MESATKTNQNTNTDTKFILPNKFKIKSYDFSIIKIIPYKEGYNSKDFIKIINTLQKYQQTFLQRFELKDRILFYHPKQPFCFEIYFTKDKISFNFIIPKIYETVFINKAKFIFNNSEIIIDKDYINKFMNGVKQKIIQQKSWMFTINTSKDINLTNNLLVIHKNLINKEDKALLQYMFQPLNSNWKNKWESKYKKYKNTGIIQGNFNFLSLLDNFTDKILDQIDMIINGIMLAICGDEPIALNDIKTDFTKELTESTKKKTTFDGFKTNINLYIKSNNNITIDNISRDVNTTLRDIEGDNSLKIANSKIIKNEKQLERKIKNGFITNTLECKQLINTPDKNMLNKYEDIIDKINVEELKLPKELLDGRGIYYGEVMRGNIYRQIWSGAHANSNSKPLFYVSPQEGGKSSFLRMYSISALENNHSIFAFDTIDGKNIDYIRDYLPKNFPEEKIVILNFKNEEYAFPLKWNEVADIYLNKMKKAKDKIDRYRIMEEFGSILSEEFEWFVDMFQAEDRNNRLSTAMKSLLGKLAQLVLMNNENFGLIKDCLYDSKLRHKLLKQLDIPYHLPLAKDILKMDTEDYRRTIQGIETRLNVILGNSTLEKYFSLKSGKKLDFAKWANNGYCVLIRVSQETADVLVPFLVQKLWLAVLSSREHMEEENRPMTHLSIDEPNRFPSIMNLLTDHIIASRKWHLRFIFCIHNMEIFRRMKNNLLSAGISCFIVPPTPQINFSTVNNIYEPYGFDALKEVERLIAKYNGKFRFALTSVHYKNANYPIILKLPLPIEQRYKKIDRSYLNNKCGEKYGISQREYYEDLFKEYAESNNEESNHNIDKTNIAI